MESLQAQNNYSSDQPRFLQRNMSILECHCLLSSACQVALLLPPLSQKFQSLPLLSFVLTCLLYPYFFFLNFSISCSSVLSLCLMIAPVDICCFHQCHPGLSCPFVRYFVVPVILSNVCHGSSQQTAFQGSNGLCPIVLVKKLSYVI